MSRQAPAWWSSRGVGAILALPLAGIFLILSAFRRLAFRQRWLASHAAPVPVLVVGNVAVGGSGKTPVVIWLVAALRARGWRPGVVSRGYGGNALGVEAVDAECDPALVGDEPVLIARRAACPVFTARNRIDAARALCHAHPDVDLIIADDGLQHYRLRRQVELVVIDPATLGNRWPLPAGPLREPLSRTQRCDLLLMHGTPDAALRGALVGTNLLPMHLKPGLPYRLGAPHERIAIAELAALRVRALAGIGQPKRFFDTVRQMGLEPARCDAFADHHVFSLHDLALGDCEALLMTEKDAIKCVGLAPPETWVLPVEAQIDDAALDIVEAALRRKTRSRAA